MIKVILVQPGETIMVGKTGTKDPIIDYIVPDGFVAVATVIIELFQKYPKGIYVPGKENLPPGEGRPT